MAQRKRVLRKGRKRAPPRAKKQTVSQAVKKYVKQTIHKDQENKIINTQVGDNFGSYLQNTVMNVIPMLPYTGFSTISQGITQGGRIGNQVKVRKLMLNYVIYPLPYDPTGNPSAVPNEIDLFLGATKQTPGLIPSVTDFQNLFQAGSSSFAPVGNLRDLVSDVNKDYWDIKKRWRHKIGYAAVTGTGANAGNQYFNNNDFKLNVVRKMDITKYVTKTLKFNDSNNTLMGKNLYFFYQAVRADGVSSSATQETCRMDYWFTLQYEDA